MHIQIVSDLHLEFEENRHWLKENPIIPVGEVLLIAGDIVTDPLGHLADDFYASLIPKFPLILTTMGNHEFYGGYLDYAYPSYEKKLGKNIYNLNNAAYIYQDVKFIVSILWSRVSDENKGLIKNKLSDYHQIKSHSPEKINISVDDTNRLHRLSLDFILQELKKPFDGKIVVMTHHIPSFETIGLDRRFSNLREAFSTDLDDIIKEHPKIKLWVHGHAHDFSQIKLHNTIVTRNPLGYVNRDEHLDFRRDYRVEI